MSNARNSKKIVNNKFFYNNKKNESSFNNKNNFRKYIGNNNTRIYTSNNSNWNIDKNNMVSSNVITNNKTNSSNESNKELVKFYLYSDAVNVNNINTQYTNIINPNTNFYSTTGININKQTNKHPNINLNKKEVVNELFCGNCGNVGHIFKNCQEPVISYGLICFYKKKTFINTKNANTQINDYYSKRTRKSENYVSNSVSNSVNNIRKYSNVPKIKILKRHETLTHTLKNMIGITRGISNQSEYDDYNADLESVVDVEEIIDMDNEYDTDKQYNNDNNDNNDNTNDTNDTNDTNNMKEITTEKIILVQRRHTIGFIEFIRGKYDITNYEYIIKLFNMMTFDEKRLFREYDNFDVIRTIIGLKRESIYKLEYDDAKKKFNELRNHIDGNMIFKLLDKSYTRWTSPEWGIPKGRRNHKEYDIECAVREFVEETGIKYKHINVYRNVKPLEEIYKGINGVVYKHIYYLASIKENDDARMNIEIIEKGGQINYEVCNVKLFNLHECHKIIRPYYISKLNVIKKGFQLINSIDNYFE